MINLLPPALKQAYRYGRINRHLTHWIYVLIFSVIGVLVILFSELLTQIATLLPGDTNLTGLSISQAQGAIDISAAAKTYASATQMQVNLSDPKNGVFSKADIVSINCSGTTTYPCTVVLRALFASNSSYMLINDGKGVSSGQ